MTFQQLVDASLRTLGVIASGESPSTEERDDALIAVNNLIASWTALGTPIYQLTKDVSVTLSGAASYTLSTRPVRIQSASVIAANGTTMPLEIVTAEKWALVPDKTRTGIFGDKLLCDYAYPSATVYITPKPSAGTLEMFVYRALGASNALADTLALPPGYERALRFNLALDLAGEYGRTAKPELLQSAAESKAAISGLNGLVLGGAPPTPPAQVPQAA